MSPGMKVWFLTTSTSHFRTGAAYFHASTVNEYIPKYRVKNVNNHPRIDKELSNPIKEKNIQRKKSKKSDFLVDFEKHKLLRHETKKLFSKKKKDYNKNLAESLVKKPIRFCSAVKSSTKTCQSLHSLLMILSS